MTPDELTAALGEAGLRVIDTQGLQWRPSTGFALGPDVSVDYFVTAVRD